MNKLEWIIGGVALYLLLPKRGQASIPVAVDSGNNYSGLSYLGQKDLPRGMRNNNPGNLRISNSNWQGKVPINMNTDGAFEQFQTYLYGIRAMIKLLLNYIQVKRLTSVREIISTYAPSTENDTNAYIRTVSTATGYPPDWPLTVDKDTIRKLVIAMASVENGRPAITIDQFNQAWGII